MTADLYPIGYETLTHTHKKRIGDKTNQNKKKDEMTQSKRRDKKKCILLLYP